MADYRSVEEAPEAEEYLRLRSAAGLSVKSREQAVSAIAGTWTFRCVRLGSELVGMGRLIGDGGWYFVVADMAVLPEHQGRGVGGRILDALLAEVDARAPGAFVSLVADPPGMRLYRSRGFVETAPSVAMTRRLGNGPERAGRANRASPPRVGDERF
jgi:GNAT superfamily N-acetyltransferase